MAANSGCQFTLVTRRHPGDGRIPSLVTRFLQLTANVRRRAAVDAESRRFGPAARFHVEIGQSGAQEGPLFSLTTEVARSSRAIMLKGGAKHFPLAAECTVEARGAEAASLFEIAQGGGFDSPRPKATGDRVQCVGLVEFTRSRHERLEGLLRIRYTTPLGTNGYGGWLSPDDVRHLRLDGLRFEVLAPTFARSPAKRARVSLRLTFAPIEPKLHISIRVTGPAHLVFPATEKDPQWIPD